MSVEFEEEKSSSSDPSFYQSRQIFGLGNPATPAMIRWIVGKRIVKNENRAARLLGIFVTVTFLLAIAIALYAAGIIPPVSTWGKKPQPVPYVIWKILPPAVQQRTPYIPPQQ